ncbi:MAG: hypothetical protein J6Q85_02640 [Clostridia bacterium]|nr:hypothetical protein [Clostridia bacterium]
MAENNTIWVWDKAVCPKNEIKIKCSETERTLKITNDGELELTSYPHLKTVINKEMIEFVRVIDMHKSNPKDKRCGLWVQASDKHLGEWQVGALHEGAFAFNFVKTKHLELINAFAAILQANSVRVEFLS